MSKVVITHKCPICNKLYVDEEYAPFCSKRCADVDLARWFNGSYAVPLVEPDELEMQELSEIGENAGQNSK